MSISSLFSNSKIGLIGYGRFGKFLCDEVLKGYKVAVFSPHLPQTIQNQNIIPQKSLNELVQNSDLIIPSVSISSFETVIKEIVPSLNKKTIILDVCSVKVYPVSVMKKYLPGNTQIIASHPLFGPKQFEKKKTLNGLQMTINNISADKNIYEEIIRYFESLSIKIIEMDEEKHDKLMAQSQFFAHLIRHVAHVNNLHSTQIDTAASKLLFEAFNNIGTNETLLRDMITYNKYCREILDATIKTLSGLQK